ncbi:hypothetical protein JCM5353_008658 [Sporobolomyces roseus]
MKIDLDISYTKTHFWAVRDYLLPVLRDSKFKETGRLTPQEFVAAGDFLSYKFPTWTWESGDASKARDYLPGDKQYLISRNVPCLRRVSQLGQQGVHGNDGDEQDEWVATHTNSNDPNSTTQIPTVIDEIPDLEDEQSKEASNELSEGMGNVSLREEDVPDMEDIPDMEDEDENLVGLVEVDEDDDAVVQIDKRDLQIPSSEGDSNVIQVPTYDCMITYDKYYQTPQMWLLGYDEQKRPLPPQPALSDVSSYHAMKTVTIEPFPHLSGLSIASVHPCKHSNYWWWEEGGGGKDEDKEKKGKWFGKSSGGSSGKKEKEAETREGDEVVVECLRVFQYLGVFLKFMSSIVPSIEVDSNTNIVSLRPSLLAHFTLQG